jgi:hypothetical protein
MRTLFGRVLLAGPRSRQCTCHPHPARTFCPLAAALPERPSPELRYLGAR